MEFHYKKAPGQVAEFLKEWPLERVREMSLNEYNGYQDPDTFSRWLEMHTISAGSMRGANSYKFEIYKRKPGSKPANDRQYLYDDTYSWRRRAGESREVAFDTTKNRLLDIIQAAIVGDFKAVDDSVFTPIAKWKLAFIYGNARTLAIYDHRVLRKLAAFRGMKGTDKAPIFVLHEFLLSLMPDHTEVYRYSYDLWMEYVIQLAPERRYWLVGSKYGLQAEIDLYEDFREQEVVATGFHETVDLTHLYGKSPKRIKDYLRLRNEPNFKHSHSAVIKFLQMKPGDIVAIKSSGTPKGKIPNLSIHALAKVVERDGEVYHYDPTRLIHCIHVEFFDEKFRSMEIGGYNRTIAEITQPEKIDQIFSGYLPDNDDKVNKQIRGKRVAISNLIRNTNKSRKRRQRKGTQKINLLPQKRRGHGGFVTKAKHNQIQSQFYEHLVNTFGKGHVVMEKNFVDIQCQTDDGLILYEVKPYDFAEDCIKAAIGQLLAYSCYSSDSIRKLVVVGPNRAEKDDKHFIHYIKNQLDVEFEYETFKVK